MSKELTPREAALEIIIKEETNPVSLMVPNGAQEKWIRLVGSHRDGIDSRIKIFSAANKVVGKSASTIAILANIVWGPQSKWFDYPLFREWPFPKEVWFISTDTALREILLPEFHKWFPRGRYTVSKSGKTFDYYWKTDTGWKIYAKTHQQDKLAYESGLIGLAICSEPPPQWIYEALPFRMPHGGLILFEMTPLQESAWLFDEFNLLDDDINTKRADIIYAGIEEGCLQHGIRGRIEHKNVQEMINRASKDPDQYIPRITGKPQNVSGRVFKMFNVEKHVVFERELAQYEQIWFVIDPHDAKPPFCQWWAVGPRGRKIFIETKTGVKEVFMPAMRCVLEYPAYSPDNGYENIRDTRLTVPDFCRDFLKIEQEFDFSRRIIRKIMDPRFGAKEYSDTSANKRMRVVELYARYGVRCRLGRVQDIDYGTQIIKQMLDYTDEYEPLITIQENCINTIRAFQKYSYVNPRKLRDDQDIASERRGYTEKWKHSVDCARYLCGWPPKYDHGDYKPRLGWREEMKRKARPKRRNLNPMAS